jgi:hypothetical protein
MTQFLTVLPVAPLEELTLPIQIEAPVRLPVVIVRLRSVPPEVEPSMVTLSAPNSLITAPPGTLPVTVRGPPAGLIVREVQELIDG